MRVRKLAKERLVNAGTVVGLDEQLMKAPYQCTYTTASFVHLFFFDKTQASSSKISITIATLHFCRNCCRVVAAVHAALSRTSTEGEQEMFCFSFTAASVASVFCACFWHGGSNCGKVGELARSTFSADLEPMCFFRLPIAM